MEQVRHAPQTIVQPHNGVAVLRAMRSTERPTTVTGPMHDSQDLCRRWTSLAPLAHAASSRWREFSIRVFDVVASVVILSASWPAMLLAALVIRLTSPGPAIYRQQRVGRHHELFTLYKFRTMRNGAEQDSGPVWATPDDDRVTRTGRLLRRTRIDELPQLFNVLRGDMSLVGPRPERPHFVIRHKALQGVRLAVRPGITGLAQIRGRYDLRPERKPKYDVLYIQNRSVQLNLYVLLQTIPAVLSRKGW